MKIKKDFLFSENQIKKKVKHHFKVNIPFQNA